MVEFSSAEMTVTAPGARQTLDILAAIDRQGQQTAQNVTKATTVSAAQMREALIATNGDLTKAAQIAVQQTQTATTQTAQATSAAVSQSARRAVQEIDRIPPSARRAAGSVRTIAFAATGVTQGMQGATMAAGMLAEQIAMVSRNARIAASAAGIGAIVIALGAGVAIWKHFSDRAKDAAAQLSAVNRETDVLRAQTSGDTRLAKELQIIAATEREIESVRKMNIAEKDREKIIDAITRKQLESFRLLRAARDQAFLDALFEFDSQPGLPAGGTAEQRERAMRVREATAERDRALRDLDRNEQGFNQGQQDQLRQRVHDRFASQMQDIQYDMQAFARQIGDAFTTTLADSIANGISAAIQSGSIANGFRALTGGILIGLGQMMQDVGTKSLLAAELMTSIVTALSSFAPAGAIGPALLLIAAGGVLKGLGASMGGKGGNGGGGGSYGGGAGGRNYGTIIDRGLVNPANGVVTSPGMITPRESVVFAPTIIGANDPHAQREIYELWDRGRRRRE